MITNRIDGVFTEANVCDRVGNTVSDFSNEVKLIIGPKNHSKVILAACK